MKQLSRVLLLGIVCSLALSGVAQADGMLLPGLGDLDFLGVRYHRVTVDILDNHAVTRVEQEFYNPHPVPVSGRYLFPIPPEAMISYIEFVVEGQRQAPILQDAATSNAELFQLVQSHRDPSYLQYADWETLALDIELPAGGSKQMSIEYDEVLIPAGGMLRYRYILSTERYSLRPLDEVSIQVDLESGGGLSSIYSSSHPVSVERVGTDEAQVVWTDQQVLPSEDFELFFTPAEGGFGSGLLTGRRDEGDHFLFLFAPELNPAELPSIPKDMVLVIDRSGSMSGQKIDEARNALHFILDQLNEHDRFSIVSFNEWDEVFSYQLRDIGRETLAEAHRYVDRLTAEGSTDIEAALQAGLGILRDSASDGCNATRMLVFLTDGLPTAGVTDGSSIAELVQQTNRPVEARLHVFGVGYDVNTRLLDRLSEENGGSVSYVRPGENLETVLTGFYQKIAYPVLTDLEIEFEGMQVEQLYPQKLPDLFQNSSLLLAGRYRADGDRMVVRVRGRAGERLQEYEYHFELDAAGEHDFVPRLWATRRIGELLDRVRVEGESKALVAEIRDLGLAYGLVTPYTAFAIQAQAEGWASDENMQLYADTGRLRLVSGSTTVEARMQNQAYQLSVNAYEAAGSNVSNSGQRSMAQVGTQNVDLNLLRGQAPDQLEQPITAEWVSANMQVDRKVEFGSQDYFELAQDPAVRPMLQTGRNVVFEYQGEIISVQDPEEAADVQAIAAMPEVDQDQEPDSARNPGLAIASERDQNTPGETGRESTDNSRTGRSDPAVAWYVVLPWLLVGLFSLRYLVGKVSAR